RILFEVGGVNREIARTALLQASHILPIATEFVEREEFELGGGEGA
ncbi:MAG: 50S ribosomal protein L16, partial [Chloroflexi bacterium]|nr:50S ribosomal protein L16 [Chloroflexota bacterium]